MLRTATKLAILDFDIENRPLTYWYKDMPTADVTAIAWSWIGEDEVRCEVQTPESDSQYDMLARFLEAYNDADIVTGHYIRKHDLPILNGAMFEVGLGLLPAKLASDTKLDLVRWNGLPQSQEYLAELLGLAEDKYHMTQHKWRQANRFADIDEAIKRVKDDVVQHKVLRQALIDEGVLGTPRLWHP